MSRHVASHADVLRGSSRVPAPPMSEHLSKVRGAGTRDEPLRTSAWEATRHATTPKKNWHTEQKLPTSLSLLFFPMIRP